MTTPIPITANPFSNDIIAPEHDTSGAPGITFVEWVDDEGNNIVDEAGNNIIFKKQGDDIKPYTVKANPYSNMIVAPEKPNG